MSKVYLLATLDTKGHEADFVRARLQSLGIDTCLIDTGCVGEPAVEPDISREAVFAAAGTTLDAVRERGDRGAAVSTAAQGAADLVVEQHAKGNVAGVLGIGGGAGTSIGTAAMRRLPLGVPKVMLSTLASGDVRAFVGDRDIVMINSVADILGLNRISRTVLAEAAHAMAGLVQHADQLQSADDKPLVAATMFGVTTACIEQASQVLRDAGYEVLVFHATGAGGQAMESLIRDGLIAGVLDITTTELADELVGGVLTAGPQRLTAAAETGTPQVVSVGATDMVNFWARQTVPEPFRDRNLYQHNENVTLMRTTIEECLEIGRQMREKLSRATGPTAILLPRQGVSAIDRTGQPFDDPAAREALHAELRRGCGSAEVIELDAHINDAEFAEAAARKLIELIDAHQPPTPPS
jgi:uncharacterized protein (UPF0261 family)